MTLPLGKRKYKNLKSVSSESENSRLTKAGKMKRIGNLFHKIIHKQNILNAHNKAKKGKSKYRTVINFEKDLVKNIDSIHTMLKEKMYIVSDYVLDKRIDRGKERIIYKLLRLAKAYEQL